MCLAVRPRFLRLCSHTARALGGPRGQARRFSEAGCLRRWLRLQRGCAEGGPTSRREAAWNAVGPASRLALEPQELLGLLDSAALCPAFSAEFFGPGGPVDERVFCAPDAFGGDLQRRQFFRNQIVRLYHEKAMIIRMTIDMLTDAPTAEDDPENPVMRGVLNGIDDEEKAEPCAEVQEMEATVTANFTLETARYPFLMGWGFGDYFFVRCAGAAGSPSGAAQLPGQWFLGEAIAVAADAAQRVSVLQLRLLPMYEAAGSLKQHELEDFDIVPVNFLPTVLRRQRDAIADLCDRSPRFTEVVQRLVFPERGEHGERGERGEPELGRELSGALCGAVNAQQRAAVAAALGPGPLTLIQGPPGTGKTAVAAAIVEAWLRQDPETPILVATGTHTAKDLIARRLRGAGIRIADRRKKARGQSPVYVETVYMAAEPAGRRLPRVLIDESTQITEASALVALGQGCERLVLIGDPQQLGPVSTLGSPSRDASPYALECGSFYEAMYRRHRVEPVLLDMQYRMAPPLRRYPAERFYGGRLVDGNPRGDFALPAAGLFSSSNPLVFLDTGDCEDAHDEVVFGTRSRRNRLEAAVVEGVVRELLAADVEAGSIGVLTSYSGQRDHICQMLHPGLPAGTAYRRLAARSERLLMGDRLRDEPHPQTHTVDGFQGCERDFVIVSAVVARPAGSSVDEGLLGNGSDIRAIVPGTPGCGFIGDRRRVCVVLTRARRGLVVVGHGPLLRMDEEWGSWLRDAHPQRICAATFLGLPHGGSNTHGERKGDGGRERERGREMAGEREREREGDRERYIGRAVFSSCGIGHASAA